MNQQPNEKPAPGKEPPQRGYTYYSDSVYGGYDAIDHGRVGGLDRQKLRDYLFALRERIWYAVGGFVLVFALVLTYLATATPRYEAKGTVRIFRREAVVMQVQNVVETEVSSAEDLNTQVRILESMAIIDRVAARLTGETRRRFLAPYLSKKHPDAQPSLRDILFKNRDVAAIRMSLLIQVKYTHPDSVIAADVVDFFLDEFIGYNQQTRVQESSKAVEELSTEVDREERTIVDLTKRLEDYRKANNMMTPAQRLVGALVEIKSVQSSAADASARLKETETRWQPVQDRQNDVTRLIEFPFVAGQPSVIRLLEQLEKQKTVLAEVSRAGNESDPARAEAQAALTRTERDLRTAVAAVVATIRSDYESAKREADAAAAKLAASGARYENLDHAAVEYANTERELDIHEKLLQRILARLPEVTMSSNIGTQNVQIVDRASPPKKPSSPKRMVWIVLGIFGGLWSGVFSALAVAYFDDRVKTEFDVESRIGLPLLGIIPLIKGDSDANARAQVVVNRIDYHALEAFRSLHAGLHIKEESKNAKLLGVTSATPGEGKSFITSNLALAFAAHGERVAIVDCDLRRPSLHRLWGVDNQVGLIAAASGTATLDEVIVRDVQPNLDVIPSGGVAQDPTKIFDSRGFESVVAELRRRYDRVLFDTVPVAAVSDTLLILPALDGAVFAIYFNRVRLRAVQFAVRRIKDVGMPIFGTVLNGLDLTASSSYYYSHYYDKTYKDYYRTAAPAPDEPRPEA